MRNRHVQVLSAKRIRGRERLVELSALVVWLMRANSAPSRSGVRISLRDLVQLVPVVPVADAALHACPEPRPGGIWHPRKAAGCSAAAFTFSRNGMDVLGVQRRPFAEFAEQHWSLDGVNPVIPEWRIHWSDAAPFSASRLGSNEPGGNLSAFLRPSSRRRDRAPQAPQRLCCRAIWSCSQAARARECEEADRRCRDWRASLRALRNHHVHFAHAAGRLAHRLNRLEQAPRFLALQLRQHGDNRFHASRSRAQLVNLVGRRVCRASS